MQSQVTPQAVDNLREQCLAAVAREAAREDFLCFLRFTDPNYIIADHIQFISHYLMLVEQGKLKRLIINLPPRHGKSELISKRFLSWFIGRNPGKAVVLATYGAELSLDFTRWVRNQFDEPLYGEIFPNLKLQSDSKAGNRWSTNKGNTVIGAGAGGAITGRGGELLIIDDIIKNSEEARSKTVLEGHWNWYRETFRTRLHPGGAIIVIMTRWVDGDLTGRLVQQMTDGDGEEWLILRLPAIAEQNDIMGRKPGQPLWPERYSIDDLRQIRASVGERAWIGLYQQSPVDILERVFDEPIMEEPPDDLYETPIVGCLDPAFEGADWTAIVFGCFKNDRIWILYGDVWQIPIDQAYDYIVDLYNNLNCGLLLVESNQAQVLVGNELKKRGLNVKKQQSIRSKYIRITGIRQYWDKIRFSQRVTSKFMQHVIEYTDFVQVPDDAPDALAGLVERLASKQVPAVINRKAVSKESFIDPKLRKIIAEKANTLYTASGFIDVDILSKDTGLPMQLVRQAVIRLEYLETSVHNRFTK